MRAGALLLVLAAALSVAACGSDEETGGSLPNQRDPRAVAQGYADALADDDAGVVCDLLDPKIATSGESQGLSCEEGVAAELLAGGPPDYLGAAEKPKITGETAEVGFSEGGFLSLLSVNGEWYVNLIR